MPQRRKAGSDRPSSRVRFGGFDVDAAQITRIRALTREHAGATRGDIAMAVCREWGWRRANGALRVRACRDLLSHLAEKGLVKLPPSRLGVVRRRRTGVVGQCFESVPAVMTAADVAPRGIVVRPIKVEELPRWREAMERFHYLGDGVIVGETLRQVAESEGRWVALLGWGAAVLKSRHREAWVGWDERTKYQRLHLVANNVRFLVLPWVHVPCLASAVLSRSLRRLSADWQEHYDHPIMLAETFVDLSRFRGTCYRAANWLHLGETRGMRRKGAGYESHGNKKGRVLPASVYEPSTPPSYGRPACRTANEGGRAVTRSRRRLNQSNGESSTGARRARSGRTCQHRCGRRRPRWVETTGCGSSPGLCA